MPSPAASPPAANPIPAPAPALGEATRAEDTAGFGSIVLAAVVEEFGPGAHELEVRVLDLGVGDPDGRYWAGVTSGPRPAHEDGGSEVVDFSHLVLVYRRHNDGSWSAEIDRLEIDSRPHRADAVDLVVLGAAAPGVVGSAWFVIHGQTGAHAGTLDVVRFDGRLETVLSHVSSRPDAGAVVDLDGDGGHEFVLNASNPYVFCYACAVEERAILIYRRDGAALRPVALGVPDGLAPGIATAAGRVVALAEADLWREAAALAVRTASRAPEDAALRWLSILVSRTAAARLAHAGSPGQPLLTNVLAGEYAAALDLMRQQVPREAFALDGPLIVGTAAETALATMAVTLLDYSGRAVTQRPADPAIHAVRALGLALAAPSQLERAREAAGRALSLDPADEFLRQAAAFLDSIESAPGLPPLPPEAEELLPGPSPGRFAGDLTLGAGDRGHFVRALQQRLARVPSLGFSDPGRYHDVYDTETREAVIQIQREADLEPTGVVDGPTWDALEAAWQQPVSRDEAAERPKPSRPPTHSKLGAPIVYLTFDDGPHPTWTPKVLELLSHYGVRATFFLLGLEVSKFPHIVNTIVDAGHEIENHTFDHVRLDEASREDVVSQVVSTDQALRDAAGERIGPIACLRPPYGVTNRRVNRIVAELGKAIVPWTVDPQDWRRPGAAQIASHVLANVHPGAIVLMHDGGGERSQTVAALETVLRGLSKRGYVFGVLCR